MRDELRKLVNNYRDVQSILPEIENAFQIIRECYDKHGVLYLCGNGGSAADCEHIAGELLKEFKIRRQIPDEFKIKLKQAGADQHFCNDIFGALPAISLMGNIGFQTAFGNDVDYKYACAQHLYALGRDGDVLWAISTSGNSDNVINTCIIAKAKNIKIVGLTGADGGKLNEFADVLIKAPSRDTARIQEYHLPIYHTICEMLENTYFGNIYI